MQIFISERYDYAVELMEMQIDERDEDSDVITANFLRMKRLENKRSSQKEGSGDASQKRGDDKSNACDDADDVEENDSFNSNNGGKREYVPSKKVIAAAEDNVTTTDADE